MCVYTYTYIASLTNQESSTWESKFKFHETEPIHSTSFKKAFSLPEKRRLNLQPKIEMSPKHY